MKKERSQANGGAKSTTYYERLTSRWQNIPVFVWLVMLAGTVAGGLSLFSSIRETVSQLWPKNEARNVDISLRPEDPRFTEAGERMNYGGGSQALFFASGRDGRLISGIDDLSTVDSSQQVYEVVGTKPITLEADAVFNSKDSGIACVIEEWGVHVEKIGNVGVGSFLQYTVGGAEGVRTYGQCVIGGNTGDYPISQYFKDDEEGPPPEKIYYLRPGEPVSMQVDITHPESAREEPPEAESSPGKNVETSTVMLTLYAKIRVKGVSSVVRSKNSLRAVFPQNLARVPWKTFHWDSRNPNSETFESLRSRCYGTLRDLQRHGRQQ